jgi:large subunit ribosomal protein L30
VTWGEVSKETLTEMIKKRGRLSGNKRFTNEYAKELGYKDIPDLAEAISNGKAKYWTLPNVRSVFRLHPPKKGFKGKIKKSFVAGGEAGYRSEKINDLIKRMI